MVLEVLVTAAILCNNFNYTELPCSAPVESFTVDANGEASGQLTTGIPFTQTNIVNDYTRLQKFQMQDANWYVYSNGIIWADSDLEALSIYLAL